MTHSEEDFEKGFRKKKLKSITKIRKESIRKEKMHTCERDAHRKNAKNAQTKESDQND